MNNQMNENFSVEELESRYEMKAWIRVRICTDECPAE